MKRSALPLVCGLYGLVKLALVWVHLHEAHAGVHIDGDVGCFPAGATHPSRPVAIDAMTLALDATELLGVHVQQLARCISLVANRRHARLKGTQAGYPFLDSRRLMVEALRPTWRAMVRIGMRARRSCSIRPSRSASTLPRVRCGRELRSAKPRSPCSWNRRNHLRAVRSLMPAASAFRRNGLTETMLYENTVVGALCPNFVQRPLGQETKDSSTNAGRCSCEVVRISRFRVRILALPLDRVIVMINTPHPLPRLWLRFPPPKPAMLTAHTRDIAGGALLDLEEIKQCIRAGEMGLWVATDKADEDLDKLQWDETDVFRVLTLLASTNYRKSEWCKSSSNSLHACDVYVANLDDEEWELDWRAPEYYIKFSANEHGLCVYLISCHLSEY